MFFLHHRGIPPPRRQHQRQKLVRVEVSYLLLLWQPLQALTVQRPRVPFECNRLAVEVVATEVDVAADGEWGKLRFAVEVQVDTGERFVERTEYLHCHEGRMQKRQTPVSMEMALKGPCRALAPQVRQ